MARRRVRVTRSPATAATRRAFRRRRPGEEPCCSISGRDCATSPSRSRRRAVPRDAPAQPPPLGPRAGPSVLQAVAAQWRPTVDPRSDAVRRAPSGEVLFSTIRPPLFPISLDEFNGDVTIHCAKPQFSVGSYVVHSGAVPHNGPMAGYRVERDDVSVTYISDHQQPDDPTTFADSVLELCRGVDLLIHDAQYTPSEFEQKRTWGHCTVEYAVSVAIAARVKRLALFHHDPYHDDDMVEQMAKTAQQCAAAHGIEVSQPSRAPRSTSPRPERWLARRPDDRRSRSPRRWARPAGRGRGRRSRPEPGGSIRRPRSASRDQWRWPCRGSSWSSGRRSSAVSPSHGRSPSPWRS